MGLHACSRCSTLWDRAAFGLCVLPGEQSLPPSAVLAGQRQSLNLQV